MNKSYSIAWGAVRNMYVAASELVHSGEKINAQACVNKVNTLPITQLEPLPTIKAKRNTLARAIIMALGFSSPLAIADNTVEYTDGQSHTLDTSSSIIYTGSGEDAALYIEGIPGSGSWTPTTVTGTDVVIKTTGGGGSIPAGGHYVSSAISMNNGAVLNLTNAQISAIGTYTDVADLTEQSRMTLTGGSIQSNGNYGVLTLYSASEATLIGTRVEVTGGINGDLTAQDGSTLNVLGGSTIVLMDGQVRIVEDAYLNMSDSSISSTGADSTIWGYKNATLNVQNTSVTHTNADGAAIEASSASTLSLSGNRDSTVVKSAGIGVLGVASKVDINGATISANGDGIKITSQGRSSFYADTNALTVNNADVTSKTAALHVDGSTVINDPIELANSTLSAPTAVKLESNTAIEADNTRLNGDIDAGTTASTLSLTNGSALIGKAAAQNGTLSLDSSSLWLMTGNSTLGNLTSSGTITLGDENGSAGTLAVGNLTLQNDSRLDVYIDTATATPSVTAQQATLGGTLNVAGIGELTGSNDYTLTVIDTDSAISGDFNALTIAGADTSSVDFITASGRVSASDNTNYDITLSLSWYADEYPSTTPAHGTFTLNNANGSFTLGAALTDVDGTLNPTNTGWDGKTLTKLGAGRLILSGNNTYSGATNVQEGTLWLAGTGVIGTAGSQQAVNVASGATFGGSNGAVVNGSVDNYGTLGFGNDTQTNATFLINGSVANAGRIVSGSSANAPGNTLKIGGDYVGNGGSLYLNTALGDDSSATDKLVVTGKVSGNTTLYIHGIGDTGAQTVNGIEVVSAGGGSSTDAFTQGNQVQAGLYEYRLYRNEDNGSWYLGSKADGGGNDQYRADIGSYLGNQWIARSLQMQTLYDREGSQFQSANGSAWGRFKAGTSDSQAAGGSVDIDSNYSQIQLGGDVLAWGNGQQSFTVGVMGSYINADTDSTGNRGADGSRFSASGKVDGYNLGVYATWFADAQTHSGMYIDSWYQYGIYSNSVDNGDVGSEDYDSTANAVSLETGYRYDIALNSGNVVSLTPQAQVTWQNYQADSVTDANGVRISGQNGDSWTSRLGLRVSGKLSKAKDSGMTIQPFAEANWLHTSDDVTVSFSGSQAEQNIPADRAELKAGIQADINSRWSVRAQVAGQKGNNDYGDVNGSLNLRYSW